MQIHVYFICKYTLIETAADSWSTHWRCATWSRRGRHDCPDAAAGHTSSPQSSELAGATAARDVPSKKFPTTMSATVCVSLLFTRLEYFFMSLCLLLFRLLALLSLSLFPSLSPFLSLFLPVALSLRLLRVLSLSFSLSLEINLSHSLAQVLLFSASWLFSHFLSPLHMSTHTRKWQIHTRNHTNTRTYNTDPRVFSIMSSQQTLWFSLIHTHLQ